MDGVFCRHGMVPVRDRGPHHDRDKLGSDTSHRHHEDQQQGLQRRVLDLRTSGDVQTPFNGTSPNASGQYSLVIWTESTANYQWKGSGQLNIQIPGVSGIKSSLSPGYLDGSGGDPGAVTAPGPLAFVPVPEPAAWASLIAGLACGAFSLWRQRHVT